MSPYIKKQKDKKRKNFFRKWHRRIGFTASLFLFNLAVTGIMLNHYEDLDLHNKYITSDWIVEWYGVSAPESVYCLPNTGIQKPICQIGEKIYYGEDLLVDEASLLVGTLQEKNLFYLFTVSDLQIYTTEMELVETISITSGLPIPINSVFTLKLDDKVEQTIGIVSDSEVYFLNQTEMTWEKLKSHDVYKPIFDSSNKQALNKLSKRDAAHYVDLYLDRQITQLKLVQDFHSGSILSISGEILTDLIGLIVILLAISGFIAWQRRKEDIS